MREDIVILLIGWFLGGILGYIGYAAILRGLVIERLRLAAHMLRSHTLHAKVVLEGNNHEAIDLIVEVEHKEKGFVKRAFRVANVNVGEAFLTGALDGISRNADPPCVIIYRNGILDAPSTITANITGPLISSAAAVIMFLLFGFIMLIVAAIFAPIFIYTTARTLRKHANMENKPRKSLGLPPVPSESPGISGLILSIFSLGLYIPLYARSLTESIDAYVLHG